MLSINLKARLKNKSFWVAMIGSIALLSQQMGIDISVYIPSNYVEILNTIFLILGMVGIVVDTSTKGISDNVTTTSTEVVTEPVNAIVTDAVKTDEVVQAVAVAEPVATTADAAALQLENETLKAQLAQVQNAVTTQL